MLRTRARAESAAREVRDLYLGGNDVSLPVDVTAIARELGINVYETSLPNTRSGMIARVRADAGTDLLVNSEHAPVRQRFTIAHELGHYWAVQHDPRRRSQPFLHSRDVLASCGTDDEEIFANQFAAELLMPEAEVRRAAEQGLDTARLAKRFHVSVDAMTNRKVNLRL